MSVFEKYRNPDGTYNGIAALSDLSGLPESEVRKIWESAKLRALAQKPGTRGPVDRLGKRKASFQGAKWRQNRKA